MIYFNISVLDKLCTRGACSLSNSDDSWSIIKLKQRVRSAGVTGDNIHRSRSISIFSDNVRTSYAAYSIINHEIR